MREITVENLVIGSGAAGFACALRLVQAGCADTAMVTENVSAGTSRNTGSDKQTYYKLSLAADHPDSVRAMARDLASGQCVDGDMTLCEAALSVRGFLYLVELGVPFPCTEYGEYMGYRTDHDTSERATSAGPYTSRRMTEALEARAKQAGIRLYDHTQALKLMVRRGRVYGVLCLDRRQPQKPDYVLFWARNVILATGGPAGMYRDSVYPQSQLGADGMAFEGGAYGKNLTEWQFGMASLRPRWNVSGSYMQVLPTFVSTAADGSDEREFLTEYYTDTSALLGAVFLKGYQWPFDVNKIFGGSSLVDLLVYRETILRGRRVWLDFRVNAGGKEIPFDRLPAEAKEYLGKGGALFGTPIQRLERINAPAISFYRDHGVDLYHQRLEIAICAQHNNGGLSTDAYWQTNVKGLYAVGEVNGSHGVTRPGGTALNAGQVGALRVAESIRLESWNPPCPCTEADLTAMRQEAADFAGLAARACGTQTIAGLWEKAAARMSACGGMIRNPAEMRRALQDTDALLKEYERTVRRPEPEQTGAFYRLRDMLLSQKVYLTAMLEYARNGGGSRGSALYTDPGGRMPDGDLPECFRCVPDDGKHGQIIQEIALENQKCTVWYRPPRPMPQSDYFFENQWRAFRQRNHLEDGPEQKSV